MLHISNKADKVLVNALVKSMLNPNNTEMYIGNLTVDTVKYILSDGASNTISLFWKAYHIAEREYRAQQKLLKSIPAIDSTCCPECGCTQALGYTSGVRCPNCDYIEE